MALSESYYRLNRWAGAWPLTKLNLNAFVEQLGIELNGITLNAGSGEIDYEINAEREICLDSNTDTRPELAADLHNIPLENESVTTVLAICVLEHVARPWEVLCEFHRVLKKRGKLIVEVPLLNPIHAAPHDYFRFTLQGLETILRDSGFSVLEKRVTQPASYGILWLWWKWGKSIRFYPASLAFLLALKLLARMTGLRRQHLDPVLSEGDYAQFIVAAEKA